MNRLTEAISAFAIAGSMLGTPALVDAASITPQVRPSSEKSGNVEKDKVNYEMLLMLMKEALNSQNPDARDLLSVVGSNPKGHMAELADTQIEGTTVEQKAFGVYYDGESTRDENSFWSTVVITYSDDYGPLGATVIVQLNENLKVYKGRQDSLALIPGSQLGDLERVSNQVLNVPHELASQEWSLGVDQSGNLIDSRFTNSNEVFGEASEVIRPDENALILSQMSRLPQRSESIAPNAA